MARTKKQPELQEIKELVDELPTTEQITLKKYIENILEEKAKVASEELGLINGTKK